MDLGVHILLAHEMPGVEAEARHGCEFNSFFTCADGATPPELLHRAIYSEVAVALKGGAWRETSMALFSKALNMSKEEHGQAMEGSDVLQQGVAAMQPKPSPSRRKKLLKGFKRAAIVAKTPARAQRDPSRSSVSVCRSTEASVCRSTEASVCSQSVDVDGAATGTATSGAEVSVDASESACPI